MLDLILQKLVIRELFLRFWLRGSIQIHIVLSQYEIKSVTIAIGVK